MENKKLKTEEWEWTNFTLVPNPFIVPTTDEDAILNQRMLDYKFRHLTRDEISVLPTVITTFRTCVWNTITTNPFALASDAPTNYCSTYIIRERILLLLSRCIEETDWLNNYANERSFTNELNAARISMQTLVSALSQISKDEDGLDAGWVIATGNLVEYDIIVQLIVKCIKDLQVLNFYFSHDKR